MALDMYVVVRMVTESATASSVAALLTLALLLSLWFILPLYKRRKQPLIQP